ncbi:MAG TPA: hypothetical protein VE866_11815 [Candidatus Binatia bacterium]|nr:hypothetical protein [Candidatus Binatia bacterium]
MPDYLSYVIFGKAFLPNQQFALAFGRGIFHQKMDNPSMLAGSDRDR